MNERAILESVPLPLSRGYLRFRNATEGRERHDLAFYLYEIYLKYVASVAIAHYLSGEAREHRVNAALKGLARPSLGEWVRFLRECVRFFEETKAAEALLGALVGLFRTKETRWIELVFLFNRLRGLRVGTQSQRGHVSLEMVLTEVVSYRNRVLGHGAALAAGHYEEFAELFGRALPQLLDVSPFLTARRLVAFDSIRVEEGSRVECGVIEYMGVNPLRREKPYVLPYGAPAPREGALYLLGAEGDLVSLDPLLVARGGDVLILNEADGAPEYLSYTSGERCFP